MGIRDSANRGIGASAYLAGSFLARRFLGDTGKKTRIHLSVRYWQPSNIRVGAHCEIRHGSSLDARSAIPAAISIGDHVRIKEYVALAAYGGFVRLADHVLIARCTTIFGHGGVTIGEHSMIGPSVQIVSSSHICTLADMPFQNQGFTRESISVEDNVWIGGQTTVLGGAVIRSNVVVGAGAVVRGELHSGWCYAGIPARQVSQLPKELPHDVEVFHRDWGLLF